MMKYSKRCGQLEGMKKVVRFLIYKIAFSKEL